MTGRGRGRNWKTFFEKGLEIVQEANISYLAEHGIVTNPYRIRGTRRLIDGLILPEIVVQQSHPKIEWLGDPTKTIILGKPDDTEILTRIRVFFKNFEKLERRAIEQSVEKMTRPAMSHLPQVETLYFPSNPRGHQIVQESPLDAWLELVFLITRFGRRVRLKKGERLELQNVKVVVEKPESYEKFGDRLRAVNLDPGRISQYYMDFLTKELRPDETYNYGHRLRSYFKDNNNKEIDAVEVLSARLKKDPEDRKAYFALWDSREDLTRKGSCPCFVSAFFRKFEEKLTLTATFRTHNALDAWPLNFYGLMAFQSAVAKKAGVAAWGHYGLQPLHQHRPKGTGPGAYGGGKAEMENAFRPHGLLPDHPGRQGNPGGAPLRGRHPEGIPGPRPPHPCSTRSPGTWPSRISTTPSTWGANWPRPRWPSRTAGSSCRISFQQSAFSSSQGTGEGKMSGGHCPPGML